MADYTITYELSTYGINSLLTYSNEIRTADVIDISFLDFISHNEYSYAVDYYRPETTPVISEGLFGLEDSYSQDPNDIEEWFGVVKLKDSSDWNKTEFRSSYNALKEKWSLVNH